MAPLWMLLATFLFALMGACVKLASATFSVAEIVLCRGIIGMAMVWLLAWRQGGTMRTTLLGAHSWRGAVGVVSLWLWFESIAALPLATAVTLNYMSPIWIAAFLFCLGWWQSKNHLEWPLVGAILLSFGGVALILRPSIEADHWAGAVMGLSSGMLAALAYLQVRKLGKLGEPEYRVVFYFSLSNVLFGLAGTLTTTRPASHPPIDMEAWLLMLGLAVSATIAQVAMTRAYRVGKTLVVANLQYTGIIFSSVLGVLLWNDVFDWHVWLGMGVILASGIAVTYYNTRNTERGKAVEETDPIASET